VEGLADDTLSATGYITII